MSGTYPWGEPAPVLVERACELQGSLGNVIRMKMIKVLGSHDQAPLSVSEVAETLGVSQPVATKHLAVLMKAGWLHRQKDGKRIHYSLNRATVAEYRWVMDRAFAHALTPCVNGFDCGTCAYASTCF